MEIKLGEDSPWEVSGSNPIAGALPLEFYKKKNELPWRAGGTNRKPWEAGTALKRSALLLAPSQSRAERGQLANWPTTATSVCVPA